MQRVTNSFYEIIYTFICTLCLLFTGCLFVSAFLNTAYSLDMDSQIVLYRRDSLVFSLLGIFLFCGFFYICGKGILKNPGKAKRILLAIVFSLHLGLGLSLVVFGRTMPAADAMSVYSIADAFAMNDTSAIHPTDSYLSYYPQQIGLVSFLEPILRIFHLFPVSAPAYHLVKCLYVLLVLCIIYFQYKTVHLMFQDDLADCFYLLLIGMNLPLCVYSSFVYSEIPSFTALSIGLYFLLKFIYADTSVQKRPSKAAKKTALFIAVVFLAWSVLIRKNSLVIIIAVLCVVLAQWMKEYKNKLLPVCFVLCLITCVTILPFVQKLYEFRGHNTLKSGVTATSYFAMGMQEASRGMGWYNGFNFYTYRDTGMDTEATNAIAKEAIYDRLSYFKEHPAYAFSFYRQKYLSQWTDGTYACRQATLANGGGRSEFLNACYVGKYAGGIIRFCNHYQNLLYLGAFWYCIRMFLKRKERNNRLADWLCLIGVFGGFLFHMLWEANSRYILLYGLLLVPYCASGLSRTLGGFYRRSEGNDANK